MPNPAVVDQGSSLRGPERVRSRLRLLQEMYASDVENSSTQEPSESRSWEPPVAQQVEPFSTVDYRSRMLFTGRAEEHQENHNIKSTASRSDPQGSHTAVAVVDVHIDERKMNMNTGSSCCRSLSRLVVVLHAQRKVLVWWLAFGAFFGGLVLYNTVTYAQNPAIINTIGYGVPISRSTAVAIVVATAFLFLSESRLFLNVLRRYCHRILPLNSYDRFHKWMGYSVFVFSVIHVCAHQVNFWRISQAGAQRVNKALGHQWLDPAERWDYADVLFRTLPGATGYVLLLVLVLITAGAFFRLEHYNRFLATHTLTLVFAGLLIAHGQAYVLRDTISQLWLPVPVLVWGASKIGAWFSLYTQRFEVLAWKRNPGNTLLVRLKPPTHTSFTYADGQFVRLCVPDYGRGLEWHPFTIVSHKHSATLDLLIDCRRGDWVQGLFNMPIPTHVHLEGPHGSPAEHLVTKSRVMIVAGSTSGLAPFLSTLQRSRCEHQECFTNPHDFCRIVWVVRRLSHSQAAVRAALQNVSVDTSADAFAVPSVPRSPRLHVLKTLYDSMNLSADDDYEEETKRSPCRTGSAASVAATSAATTDGLYRTSSAASLALPSTTSGTSSPTWDIFVTKPALGDLRSSLTLNVHAGRPQWDAVMEQTQLQVQRDYEQGEEAQTAALQEEPTVLTVWLYVCGPRTLMRQVQEAAAQATRKVSLSNAPVQVHFRCHLEVY